MDSTGFGLHTQLDEIESAPKSATELMLAQLFLTASQKLQKFCNLLLAEIDGIELIGILAVLQQYMLDSLHVPVQNQHQHQQQQEIVVSSSTKDKEKEKEKNIDNDKEQPPKECSLKTEEHSLYLVVMLYELRTALLDRLKTYMGDQIAWILAQKSDPKKAGVLIPISKFPSLVRQVLEMTGGQVGEYFTLSYHTISYLTLFNILTYIIL